MNYLSHYFIDHRTGDDFHNTGLLLPDISKRHVISFKNKPAHLIRPEHLSLLEGCLQHYRSDAQFHASAFFGNYQQKVNQAIKESALSDLVQRKWFLAHILTELMIDRVIVTYHPEQVDAFYDALMVPTDEELISFLRVFDGKEISLFMDRYNHFRTVRYIYYYADTNKFVYSLTRIMMRAGLPEMQDPDKLILANLCDDIERRYFSDPDLILNELKQIFK